METDHLVLLSDVVQERVFVVSEERVWYPDALGELARQRHDVTRMRSKGQSLVIPVLIKVDGDRVVLRHTCIIHILTKIVSNFPPNRK